MARAGQREIQREEYDEGRSRTVPARRTEHGGTAGALREIRPSSAIRGPGKRRFPEMLDDDNENAEGASGTAGVSRKKKNQSTALVDAVSILAAAKAEGEEKKFEFLAQHLQQQGELRHRELELEREKLEIERERNHAEQRRSELMILQLQASFRAGTMGGKGRKERRVPNHEDNDLVDLEVEDDEYFNISNL